MTYARMTVGLAGLLCRLGLAGADDDALRATVERVVSDHFRTRAVPAWMDELLDAVLAGRRTDGPVPVGGVDDAMDLFRVLWTACLAADREPWLHQDGRGNWTWVLPRLNLVLQMTTGPDRTSGYTLTRWAEAYPFLTVGLATILHRLGLAGADDETLRADVHEAVWGHLDDEPPAWMNRLVEAILRGRQTDHLVTIPVGYPDGEGGFRNILADLSDRFPLAIDDEGEWWEWDMPALDLRLWVNREVDRMTHGDCSQYTLTAPPTPRA